MEVVKDNIFHLWDGYLYYLNNADPRVKGWLLMDSYSPTLCLTAAYLLIIWAGQKYMANRPAFQLRYTLFAYNMFLVAVNFHIFYELLTATTAAGYSYSCQTVKYTDDPNEVRILKALWWYYFSKLLEFMDTIFFVLRRKNSQASFLHVYHHATMFPIWWMGVKWVGGGQSFFGAMINSFIHVVMYSYYGFAALGPQFQKYLWWKRYLTNIQLIQFFVGMVHAVQSLLVQCPFPLWMQWALLVYGTTIVTLFVNFYLNTYVKPSKKEQTNGTVHSNGSVANDSKKKN